jgi:hypothetical protein
MNTKICSKCKQIFELSCFYSNGKYLRSACKKCEDKRIYKYKKKSERVKERDRKRSKIRVKKLPDEYVKKLLKTKKPTKELIELKKLEIQLKRGIKKWKNT